MVSVFKNAFVVTGNIGTGKSKFCQILSKKGFDILDADKIAHGVLENLHDELICMFGKNAIKDKIVNRAYIASIVFSDKAKLQSLENLVHPLVEDEIMRICNKLESLNRLYFIEISMFYEKFKNKNFAKVVVVYAPSSLSFSRVKLRNGWSDEEIKARLALQMDIEKKKSMADFVIDNSGNEEDLKKNIDKLLMEIKERV